jgi:tetratricopeptide (TPR) repeat protein
MPENREFEAHARYIETNLLFREGTLTRDHLLATLDRVHVLGRRGPERRTHALAGEWHQSQGRHTEAIDAFAQAIAMAHEVNLRDTDSEARRGLSLARLGRIDEAQAAAASAERDPQDAPLATLYLALNQPDQARDHAREGYTWAWANGPPYVHHWPLEECRAVLRALKEPEPQLPPFDPEKHKPFPWEANIHRMLAEHAAKKRAADSVSPDRG